MDKRLLEVRKETIYNLICDDLYVPMKVKEIAIVLQIARNDRDDLKEVLDALVEEGKVELTAKGKYIKSEVRTNVGTFEATSRGFGFISIENSDQDLFVSEKDTNNAMHGDLVHYKPFPAWQEEGG